MRAVFSCFQRKFSLSNIAACTLKSFIIFFSFVEKNFSEKEEYSFRKDFNLLYIFFIFHADHPNADWMFLITIKVFLITLKIKENHLFPLYIHGLNEMLNEREYYMRKKHKIVFVVFDSLITLYILCFTAFVFIQKIAMRKCVKNIP